MLPALHTLHSHDGTTPSSSHSLDTLSLPLPQVPLPATEDILITLTATYLLYALTAAAWTTFSLLPQDSKASLSPFADVLQTRSTLLQWLPYLQNLSTKYMDSTLTRAYSVLTKSSSAHPSLGPHHAEDVYRIRLYGLLLLLGTSPSTLKPDMFWDQTIKFAVAFVKSATADASQSVEAKDAVTKIVLDAFDDILKRTLARTDRASWMAGHRFIAFCEYWMDFARRVCPFIP